MRAAIIGYGSIGARHEKILRELGCDLVIVSKRSVTGVERQPTFEAALASGPIDYVVVSNQTALHGATLMALAEHRFAGHVLVEKPALKMLEPMPLAFPFASLHVAYNLRFHPVVDSLRAALDGADAISVQAYVGQYLPDWRPASDYRSSYSSHAAQGGGALRDLSHELDYLSHLFGAWRRVCAVGGHWSTLEGDSDDVFVLMIEFERCRIATVQLNYLDRLGRREIIVNTNTATVAADLVASRARVVIGKGAMPVEVTTDDSYRAMHEAVLYGRNAEHLCDFAGGIDTIRLIEAAELSSKTKQWISNACLND